MILSILRLYAVETIYLLFDGYTTSTMIYVTAKDEDECRFIANQYNNKYFKSAQIKSINLVSKNIVVKS